VSNSGDSTGDSSQESYGYEIEIAFLVILLLAAVVLTGFVGYLAFRITEFRKEQLIASYSGYNGGGDAGTYSDFHGSEMVNR
jgi:hypothetical protein